MALGGHSCDVKYRNRCLHYYCVGCTLSSLCTLGTVYCCPVYHWHVYCVHVPVYHVLCTVVLCTMCNMSVWYTGHTLRKTMVHGTRCTQDNSTHGTRYTRKRKAVHRYMYTEHRAHANATWYTVHRTMVHSTHSTQTCYTQYVSFYCLVCTVVLSYVACVLCTMYRFTVASSPGPIPVFQCCTLKNGRAWYAKSRELRHY